MSAPFNQTDRARWMGLMARAPAEALTRTLPDLPPHEVIRAPEIGTVMVQGRAGGTGAPFNLGEVTVTRCAVRLENGDVGHAHVQGRNRDHAIRAAILDARLQSEPALREDFIESLERDEADATRAQAERAAATRVEFFTMTRGEDE